MVQDLFTAPVDSDISSRENARGGSLLTGLLLKLVAELQTVGVPLIALKGPGLSQFLSHSAGLLNAPTEAYARLLRLPRAFCFA